MEETMAYSLSNNKSHSSRLNDWLGTGQSAASGVGSYMSTGNTPWGAIGAVAKKGYGALTGHNDSNYSDLEESMVYPLQGAATGSMFGPWGALGGALYGLGYSFKDDLGLKDNKWYTNILFPIGLGDDHKGIIQMG